jgi:hypothetical protein
MLKPGAHPSCFIGCGNENDMHIIGIEKDSYNFHLQKMFSEHRHSACDSNSYRVIQMIGAKAPM